MRVKKSREKFANLIYAGIVLAIMIILGFCLNDSFIFVVMRMMCMGLMAVALNLQYGFGGMTNLGGGLIFSLAGYALMVGCANFNWPLLPSVLFAIGVMIIVSAGIGYICLKNNMLTFTFCTMGLTMVAYTLISKNRFLGRDTGLIKTIAPSWMSDITAQYFVFLAVVAVSLFVIYRFTKSPFMQIVVGARENDERLTYLGVNIRNVRLVVFIISGMFSSIGGILFAIMSSGVYLTNIDPLISIQAILMCIIGGASTFLGPIFGAVIVVFVTNSVSSVTPYFKLVLGLITIASVYLIPNGIFGKETKLMRLIDHVFKGTAIESEQDLKKADDKAGEVKKDA